MQADFIKMHGAGNDFVVLDERVRPLDLSAAQIRQIADRRRGVGGDGVVRLRPATAQGADVLMVIHNADGSVSGTCGNATRCVASLVAGERDEVVVETLAGLLPARLLQNGEVAVDMGVPRLEPVSIGAHAGADTLHLPIEGDPAGCSMGNPHATFFVSDFSMLQRGAALRTNPLFAGGANIGFAIIEARDRISLRVWERGAGLTLACGSGACAAVVNAHRRGLSERRVAVAMEGGTLGIEWREADGHVLMTGPAATSFTGSLTL